MLSFDHFLYQASASIADADVAIVIDADVPWMPQNAPGSHAYVAVIGTDSITTKIPTFEFCANLRLNSDPLSAINALLEAATTRGCPRRRDRKAQEAMEGCVDSPKTARRERRAGVGGKIANRPGVARIPSLRGA